MWGVVGRLSSNFSGVKGGKQRRDQSRKQDFEKVTLEQRGVERERRLHAEKGPQVALEREEGLRPRLWKIRPKFIFGFVFTGFCPAVLCSPEPPGSVGVSGCAAGQKGPGRQCSLAFLQDHNDAYRRPIKGLLPLELRGSRRETLNQMWQF